MLVITEKLSFLLLIICTDAKCFWIVGGCFRVFLWEYCLSLIVLGLFRWFGMGAACMGVVCWLYRGKGKGKEMTAQQADTLRGMYDRARAKESATYTRLQQAERLLISASAILSGDNQDPDCRTSLIERIEKFLA